jgi:acyl-coenzyme A synthetase/AMP-(fatty) acid ligase/acyl carrier protein
MIDALASHDVTRIVLVPSLLSVILEEVPDLCRRAPRLKLWASTGEALSRELFDRFGASVPGGALLNLYGATEVWDAAYHYAVDTGETEHVPIGKAVPNVRTLVLDRHMNRLPEGIRGELYIGGASISRGYLNHPDLTAGRFIPDPTSSTPGARLYKTGDLARLTAGGTVELLGRADQQVKVRGHRIDLVDVEAKLASHPSVKQVAVIKLEDELIAFIVARDGNLPESSRLREFLRQSLPDAMAPAVFTLLDQLPQTISGKVDRRKLASMRVRQNATEFTPPRTPTECEIAEIWRELFAIQSIGIHDDFFDLGGHSLLAARLLSRLRARFSVDLAFKDVFTLSTVESLAAHLDDLLLLRVSETEIEAALDRLSGKTDEQIWEMMRAASRPPQP